MKLHEICRSGEEIEKLGSIPDMSPILIYSMARWFSIAIERGQLGGL
jgi:hypothetical protein